MRGRETDVTVTSCRISQVLRHTKLNHLFLLFHISSEPFRIIMVCSTQLPKLTFISHNCAQPITTSSDGSKYVWLGWLHLARRGFRGDRWHNNHPTHTLLPQTITLAKVWLKPSLEECSQPANMSITLLLHNSRQSRTCWALLHWRIHPWVQMPLKVTLWGWEIPCCNRFSLIASMVTWKSELSNTKDWLCTFRHKALTKSGTKSSSRYI